MGTGVSGFPPSGPEQCYGTKTVVEAHNACAGDPYFPFVLDATVTWHKRVEVFWRLLK